MVEGCHTPVESFENDHCHRNAHDVFLPEWMVPTDEDSQHPQENLNWGKEDYKTNPAAAGIILKADIERGLKRPVWDDQSYSPVFSGE